MKSNTKRTSRIEWRMVAFMAVILVVAIGIIVLFVKPIKKVSNFEECIAAGGARLESYPEQCLYDKKTYVNEAQFAPENSVYIGMEEAAALEFAESNSVPARVVERDGEGLPTTMDFVFGRHNFYVRDGLVYKLDIEGRATDAN